MAKGTKPTITQKEAATEAAIIVGELLEALYLHPNWKSEVASHLGHNNKADIAMVTVFVKKLRRQIVEGIL